MDLTYCLPKGNVRRDILLFYKELNFYVIFIIMGFKGPGTAVVVLVSKKDDETKIMDTLQIKSQTVSVEIVPKENNESYIFGISDETTNMFASLSSLNQFLELEMEKMIATETENFINGQNKVEYIKNDLKCSLDCSDYEIYSFGSRGSGLATPNSDCDFFIDTGEMYNGTKAQSQDEQGLLLEKLLNMLKEYPNKFSDFVCIKNARVPIIRFKHVTTGLSCDISCLNGICVENTHLVKKYLEMDSRVKWVVTAVLIWSKQNDLIGHKGFTSYAIVWMTLFVLMQFGVLVPVTDLQKLYQGPKKTVAGWECGFCQGETTTIPTTNEKLCQELLKNFFFFFGYQTKNYFRCSVLCPLNGKRIDKNDFVVLSLPLEFQSYVQNLQLNTGNVENFNVYCPLCVQDPLLLSYNITSNVDGAILKRFKMLCRYTFNKLLIIEKASST